MFVALSPYLRNGLLMDSSRMTRSCLVSTLHRGLFSPPSSLSHVDRLSVRVLAPSSIENAS